MTFNYVSHNMLQYTVNKLLALIASSGGGSGITQQDLDAKENALTITTFSTNIVVETGKYYRGTTNFNSLTITLPTMATNVTKPAGLIVCFSTGASPAVTIQSAGGQTISKFSGYSIAANKTYELNFVWNGEKWIVSHGTV